MSCLLLALSSILYCLFFFFFNDTATTEIYTLSLHDALPISLVDVRCHEIPEAVIERRLLVHPRLRLRTDCARVSRRAQVARSEEHTSELQSQSNLVCRLLLEKKKKKKTK